MKSASAAWVRSGANCPVVLSAALTGASSGFGTTV